MVQKLFWEDPYMRECEAVVTKVEDNKVCLDKTIFFAFSGGQESDSGTINDIPVKEAAEEGDEIYYTLEDASNLSEGDRVKVKIDWFKRFRIMRLHSAVHIAYHFFAQKAGEREMIGSNITADKGRMDFLYPESIATLLPEMEREVNEFIEGDVEIRAYEDPEKPGMRIWEVSDLGKMDCAGTHVRNTDEIGAIRLKRKNIGAGKERVEIILA